MQGIELTKDFLGCRQSRLEIITPGAIGTCPIRSTIKAISNLLKCFWHDRMVRSVSRQSFRETNAIQAASSISASNHSEHWIFSHVWMFTWWVFESIWVSQMLLYSRKQTVHKWWPKSCSTHQCSVLILSAYCYSTAWIIISLCVCFRTRIWLKSWIL